MNQEKNNYHEVGEYINTHFRYDNTIKEQTISELKRVFMDYLKKGGSKVDEYGIKVTQQIIGVIKKNFFQYSKSNQTSDNILQLSRSIGFSQSPGFRIVLPSRDGKRRCITDSAPNLLRVGLTDMVSTANRRYEINNLFLNQISQTGAEVFFNYMYTLLYKGEDPGSIYETLAYKFNTDKQNN